jgi:signal transduction histidine kinase
MLEKASVAPEEQGLILSSLSPGRLQKRLALAVVLVFLTAFLLIVGPLSSLQPRQVDAFVPAYTIAIFVSDAITAFLLFTQFGALRTPALLLIASGYLFSALMLIPWFLAFPGVFGSTSLIGGLQSTPYLDFFRHVGFPMFVIGYALSKDAKFSQGLLHDRASVAIALSVALTGVVVFAAAFLFIAGDPLLPRLQFDSRQLSMLWPYVGIPTVLFSTLALVVLWTRWRSVLDLWVMVMMCAYAMEIFLSYFPVPMRYTVGWYSGRLFGLLSSSLVLFVLLYEITTLYERLLRAVLAQRREREARLITGDAVAATIAHEIKQPLVGMITSADAGLRFLARATPDLAEAKGAFEQIVADGHRASDVIGRIRAVFRKDVRKRSPIDVNDLIGDTVALLKNDLQKRRIQVHAERNAQSQKILGDRIQLQQVLLNLMANAIDAMTANDEPRTLSIQSEPYERDWVRVFVADTGAGISSENIDQIFGPLFTTKPDGMGMGLSICRSIVEAHGGRLWVGPNVPRGAVFQFTLPIDQVSLPAATTVGMGEIHAG